MEKVEADLSRSKSLREKQTKEFGHQLEELQQKYEQQVSIETDSLRVLNFSVYTLDWEKKLKSIVLI